MSYPPPSPNPHLAPPQADLPQSALFRPGDDHQPKLINIPVTPLSAVNQQVRLKRMRLDIESPEVLRLYPVPARPPWVSRLTLLVFVGCLGFMIYAGLQGVAIGLDRQDQSSVIIWSCFAGFPFLILLGLVVTPFFKPGPLVYRFDQGARLLTIERTIGLSKRGHLVATYSLEDATGLQLLYDNYRSVQAGLRPANPKTGSYEMNLVMRNNRQPRINLAVHSDWRWMRQAGTRLAEYLDVTLVDQLCQD